MICLAEYEEGEPLKLLACGHCWHEECLGKWISHRRTCPLCQRWDSRLPQEQPAVIRRRHHHIPAEE